MDKKLEKALKDLNKKVDKLLEEIYLEEVNEIESGERFLFNIDHKSYEKICKYLKTKDIPFMGIS